MLLEIRPITPAQIPEVQRLIDASVRVLQAPDYTEAQREAAVTSVFTVDSRLVQDGSYFGVHTEDGSIVACGGWSARKTLYGGDHQVESADAGWLDPAVDAARIRAIFVHPDWARRGLGKMLLSAAEQAAWDAGFRRFEMGSTLTGVALYKREGYCEMERIQVPVGNSETIEVVRMTKSALKASDATNRPVPSTIALP
jgi:GNAT superfamily N-acetyltransferase